MGILNEINTFLGEEEVPGEFGLESDGQSYIVTNEGVPAATISFEYEGDSIDHEAAQMSNIIDKVLVKVDADNLDEMIKEWILDKLTEIGFSENNFIWPGEDGSEEIDFSVEETEDESFEDIKPEEDVIN